MLFGIRAARRIVFLWHCLLFALAVPSIHITTAHANITIEVGKNVNKPVAALDTSHSEDIVTELEISRAREDQYARDKAIALAQLEIIAAGNSRLENWVGIFGLLLTVILFVFGFATYRQAAAAATTAVREEFSYLRTKIEGIVEAAETQGSNIEAAAKKAAESTKAIADSVAIVGQLESQFAATLNQATPITSAEKEQLKTAAGIVNEKPQDQWSIDEYKAKIGETHYVQRDWANTIHIADEMLLQYPMDLDALCFANNMKGDAQRELGKYSDALKHYDIAINSYNLLPNRNSLPSYLSACHGKGSCLIYTQQARQAVKIYRSLLPIRIKEEGREALGTLVTRHMFARSILALGHTDQAITHFKILFADRKRIEGESSKGAVLTGCWLTQAQVEANKVDEANSTLKELGDIDETSWSPRYLALLAFTQGQVFDAEGNYGEATKRLTQADGYYIKSPPENSYYRERFKEYMGKRQKSQLIEK
jgi:tetratricopeptide (TPR) repeat protein